MKKEYRIKKNFEFNEIIQKQQKIHVDTMILFYVAKKKEKARIGISVSKKLGNAVIRNKIKRQIRSILQSILDFDNCDKDIVIFIKKKYLEYDYLDNEKQLKKALKKVIM